MTLPSSIVEELSKNEMLLVVGGNTDKGAVNNGNGHCTGINNGAGTCDGMVNNGDGTCGKS